jgi:hypothetical protein
MRGLPMGSSPFFYVGQACWLPCRTNAIDKIPDLSFTDRDEKNQHGWKMHFTAVE